MIRCLSFLFFIFSCCLTVFGSEGERIDLSGKWYVQLDSTDQGMYQGWENTHFIESINLPGTTDDAGLGVANHLQPQLTKPQLTHLTRKNSFVGVVWYTREIVIPKGWQNRDFIMKLERVLWESRVWVDGVEVGKAQNSLVAPHYFDLTSLIKPGSKHRLTIRIDNRKKMNISVDDMGHAYTNHTQIMWNGVIGEMCIEALSKVRINNLKVYPNIKTNTVNLEMDILNNTTAVAPAFIKVKIKDKKSKKTICVLERQANVQPGERKVFVDAELGDEIVHWNEFAPHVYELQAELAFQHTRNRKSVTFGMREIVAQGTSILINNKVVFLRGTLECNVFPLTGHPPMDKEGWRKVFMSAKEWGLNHLRFHSWCPPESAFAVADELGFYLQVELPVWENNVGQDEPTLQFLYEEADRIIAEYGNHPSFCFWSMGNELQGDFDKINRMVKDLKERDNRHLFTATSFTFEADRGVWPEKYDDFLISQWTKKGWLRGQGVFDSESPSFNQNYAKGAEGVPVPIVTHEIGQYAVYPNIGEIEKYKGVLLPLNFMAIKNDLAAKGLLSKAHDFTQASGKLAAILYKEEIERALKTPEIAGYQLLDLHDFPGQGTALVGMLDAFWESKNIISASDFRKFCAPVVPLLQFPKAIYSPGESFLAEIDISNYGGILLEGQGVTWSIKDDKKVLASDCFETRIESGYNSKLGAIDIALSAIKKATKLTIEVRIDDTDYRNTWNIWVYPQTQILDFGDVVFTRELEEAKELLRKGKNVLLNPEWKSIDGVEGKFVPVFWSPVHFPKQAGTMGLLCNTSHKALTDFPTDYHSDWQWWDLTKHSTSLVLDSVFGGNPIVEVIDNFTNNRRLANLFEGRVDRGKLIVASFDLTTDLDNRPVAKQMLISLLKYMNGSEFDPPIIKNPQIFDTILKPKMLITSGL